MTPPICKSVDAYQAFCCGPYWMCKKHHDLAMKLIGQSTDVAVIKAEAAKYER